MKNVNIIIEGDFETEKEKTDFAEKIRKFVQDDIDINLGFNGIMIIQKGTINVVRENGDSGMIIKIY